MSAEELKALHQGQIASVVAAHGGAAFPERLSPDFPPAPYDRSRYLADPKAYLSVVEPGRCWQTARPETGAPTLAAVGTTRPRVPELGTVNLTVAAPVGASVSYTSMDMGAFANGLAAITVQADETGRATAPFTATAGTIAEVRIIVGCPEAVGKVAYVVTVINPHASQASAGGSPATPRAAP